MKKALLEFSAPQCQILTEDVDEKTGERVMRVAVKWQHAGIVNGNKRRYSREILQREMERLQPMMDKGAVYGAAYHPKDDAEVPDISHLWESFKMEEDGSCTGVVKVLPTSHGKDAQVIIKHGGHIGMSSRGYGTSTRREVEVNGKKITIEDINDDFRLKSPGDFVLTPSVPDAGVQRMIESRLSEDEDQEPKTQEDSVVYKQIEELRQAFPELFKPIDEELAWLKERVTELESQVIAYVDAARGVITALADMKGVVPEEKADEPEAPAAEPAAEPPAAEPAPAVASDTTAAEEPPAAAPEAPPAAEPAAAEEPKEKAAEPAAEPTEVEQLRAENAALKAAEAKRLANAEIVKAIETATEKDTAEYQRLIREELVKDGVAAVDKVEDVENKVADVRKKISDLRAAAVRDKVEKAGIGSKGVVPNPEGPSSKLTEEQIRSRWQGAMKAGYKGTLEQYSKLLS